MAVHSPQSGALIADVARCEAADVDRAVKAARAAQPGWTATPLIERVQIMCRIHGLFATRAEEVLRHRGLSFPSTQEQTNNKRLVLTHRPLGVVGVITPYNFPTDIASIALAHIIASGNTAVWKPSEFSPICCNIIAEICSEAGLPPGVLNVVHGMGDIGAAIVEHGDVDGIFLTGSTAAGLRIAEKAALRPRLLELGGDGPATVLADADIDAAVAGAINARFYYAGQVCTSGERLLVHADIHAEFVSKLKARVAQLRIGDPGLDDTDMGPLRGSATLACVVNHVEGARALGAEVTQYGTVNINETSNYWDQLAPFGGTGNSGVGRELSQWFLERFTEQKLLVFDLGDTEVRYNRRAEGGW